MSVLERGEMNQRADTGARVTTSGRTRKPDNACALDAFKSAEIQTRALQQLTLASLSASTLAIKELGFATCVTCLAPSSCE
jgi:hypothetical protein